MMNFIKLMFPILDRTADGALSERDFAPIERTRAVPTAHQVSRAEMREQLADFGGQPSDCGNGNPEGCGLGLSGDPDDLYFMSEKGAK